MEQYLVHYGIKGMKWGVRKARVSGTTRPKRASQSADSKRAAKYEQRGIKSLSNDELKSLINRRQLEKQYRDIKKQDISKGQQVVERIITTGAASVGAALITKYITKRIVG